MVVRVLFDPVPVKDIMLHGMSVEYTNAQEPVETAVACVPK